MIVYVESNFVVEIALEQEEVYSALAILELAEAGKIELVIPAFALSEPFSTVKQRGSLRRRACDEFEPQLKDLERSQSYKAVASNFRAVPIALREVEKEETDRLVATVSKVLRLSRSVELSSANFARALSYEAQYDLSPQDAIVYACVLDHLAICDTSNLKCFLSRDRDFKDSSIDTELGTFGCRYWPSFREGLGYINSTIST